MAAGGRVGEWTPRRQAADVADDLFEGFGAVGSAGMSVGVEHDETGAAELDAAACVGEDFPPGADLRFVAAGTCLPTFDRGLLNPFVAALDDECRKDRKARCGVRDRNPQIDVGGGHGAFPAKARMVRWPAFAPAPGASPIRW